MTSRKTKKIGFEVIFLSFKFQEINENDLQYLKYNMTKYKRTTLDCIFASIRRVFQNVYLAQLENIMRHYFSDHIFRCTKTSERYTFLHKDRPSNKENYGLISLLSDMQKF